MINAQDNSGIEGAVAHQGRDDQNRGASGRKWLSLGAASILGILLGCGVIGGAGQCHGVHVSGICVTVDSITPTDPVGFGGDTNDVDAYQAPDCDLDLSTPDAEPIGDHAAIVNFSATAMPGVTVPPAPEFVTFTHYTISYLDNPSNLGTDPPLTGRDLGETMKIPTNSSATFTLQAVSIQTKDEYGLGGGDTLPQNYTLVYSFYGTTQFNKIFYVVANTNVDIGDWNNCDSGS
ncbi:MAG TPA: hypothetical protein VI702_06885 [Nitrospiria bacterium]